MGSAPTLTMRLLAWLAVLGLVFAGAWSGHAEGVHGTAELRWGTETAGAAKFVASPVDGGAPVAQSRLHKEWDWAACPPTMPGVFARSTWVLAFLNVQRSRSFCRGPSLVGVVELRI